MPRLPSLLGYGSALLVLAACGPAPVVPGTEVSVAPQVTIYPQARAVVVTHTPEPTVVLPATDGAWRPLSPGIDYALVEPTVNGQQELVLATRIDPNAVDVRVLYDPDAPRTAREWSLLSGADIVINGGFFDAANRVTGLLISDGQTHGSSYRGFGGMFAWRDGAPTLDWLRDAPYRADVAIAQAVQGFPMLVQDGAAIDGISDNGERNRRSFVAVDRAGRLILGVTQLARWTLTDLSQFLAAAPEFDAWRALNLDGGASAGLWLGRVPAGLSMNSFDPIPAVITVTSR